VRHWFESLRVRGKLAVVFAVQLAVLTLGCLGFLAALREMSEARNWADHTHRVIEEVEALRSATIEQQTGLRGYIITSQARFLEAYHHGISEFEAASAELKPLIRDNPPQFERFESLLVLMRDWQTEVAATDIALVEKGDTEIAARNTAGGAGKRRIDAIKKLCDEMIGTERNLLVQRAGRVDRIERVLYGMFAGLLLAGWLTGMTAVRIVNRALGLPLSRLADLVPRVTAGESLTVPYQGRRDEVGVLAGAFEQLREASVEQRQREWVAEQGAQLMNALQQADSDESFGEILLRRLSGAIKAGYALAYRWNEQTAVLEWCAAYGLPDESVTRRRFKLGEGMVGQSIVERRSIELTPVPQGYLKVVSGLGAALPATVLFVPITARGETVAVLELGLLHVPDAAQRELIDQVTTTSGLAWSALSRSLRTRELLEDSQALTEQLQSQQEALRTQQEELRAVNETLRVRSELLEEQSRRLRASEEELRAQAEELRMSNAALEEKSEVLRSRQTELETARDELQRKAIDLELASRYKSEFLANMSHELRTPLNSMLILSRTLADNVEGNLDAEQIESARIVHDSGRSLLNLINDILDLSKVEAGKMQITLDHLRVQDCLNALIERFRPLAQSKNLNFTVRVEPGTPETLHTDGERLTQILTNLLSNAFKFTHEGEIELIAEPAHRGVALSVRDSGIGIPPEKLAKVFQAFEQADSSTSRRYGGTGLGLSIVDRMTTLLGGEIKVSSEEGKGSVFTVLLPVDAPEMRAVEPPDRMPAASAAVPPVSAVPPVERGEDDDESDTPTLMAARGVVLPPVKPVLLIVEDDAGFAKVLADIANKRGIETAIAGNGQQALMIARRRPLIGVLLDIGLPDISGWEVLEKIKADPRTANVPVHVVSGADDSSRGRELGALGVLRKPVEREAIQRVLEQVAGPAQGDRRLLVVDDDAASRASIRLLFARERTQVVEVNSGEDGLRELAQQHFDGVILDLNLPDISGFEFLDRAAQSGPLPPVVIYSGTELSPEDLLRVRAHTQTVIVKGARSSERLLDEVHLFLRAIERPGPAHVVPTPHEPLAELAGKTVLVVDDDMRNVFALSKALRLQGLQVVMAQDGYKALTQLEARADIDLVLMDIMMPGMDGYETMRRIRAKTQWQSLPIIAVTAKAMKGDREKCLEAGANDYCPKPINIEQLVSQLRVWI
jgi:CheY-like chemotaxis protein/CHASE3 domain sensor protein